MSERQQILREHNATSEEQLNTSTCDITCKGTLIFKTRSCEFQFLLIVYYIYKVSEAVKTVFLRDTAFYRRVHHNYYSLED
jgi:hypothetical protein